MISDVHYSKEIDIWSFGAFAQELATGAPPFAKCKTKKDLFYHIKNKPVDRIPKKWSRDFQNFINMCMKKRPEERYTIKQLLYEHKFLREIDVEKCK